MAPYWVFLAGIKKLHKLTGHSTQGFHGFLLKLTLQGMKRLNVYISRQAASVTPHILEKIYWKLDMDNELDAIFWSTCLVGFFLLFRKSNLIPDTRWGFDGSWQLKHADLVYTGKNIVVGIRWAKNHQFSRELLTFPLPVIPGSPLCPYNTLNNVFRLVDTAPAEAHLFSFKDGSSLSYPQFQKKLRSVLVEAGVENPSHFSSHSLRRGVAALLLCVESPQKSLRS